MAFHPNVEEEQLPPIRRPTFVLNNPFESPHCPSSRLAFTGAPHAFPAPLDPRCAAPSSRHLPPTAAAAPDSYLPLCSEPGRAFRKSASSHTLAQPQTSPFHSRFATAPRRRRSAHHAGLRPSPSRDSFFFASSHRNLALARLVDEAMGANRSPHRHCDPPMPSDLVERTDLPPETLAAVARPLLSPITRWGPGSDTESTDDEKLPPKSYGVLKMQVISSRLRSGGGWGVRSVYVAMCMLSTMTSIENNSLPVVEPYYLSLFGGHGALSTVAIITNIAFAIGKPPMSKIMDNFGRAEGVLLATALYFIGAILTSSATSVTQYGIARVASALGSQGLQLAQMIIVADTSSLSSRALLTSTISSPWILTTWIGPVIGSAFKSAGPGGYRAIYALFGILVPLCALWLAGVLFWEWRTLRKLGLTSYPVLPELEEEEQRDRHRKIVDGCGHAVTLQEWHPADLTELWTQTKNQLDILGILLLTVGCSLLLLPLSLNTSTEQKPRSYALLLVGAFILLVFCRYESLYATSPIIPTRLLKQRTIVVGSGVCFWHFMCQYIYESYFTSFLQVARFSSARDAQYIQESYMFTACISALICGVLVRWSRRYKIWVIVGILLHSAGTLLMLRTRKLDNPISELVISQIIAGFGGGFTTLASQLGVQAVVAHQDVSIATAVFLTVTQIGGAVGSSVAGGVWNAYLPFELRKRGVEEGELVKIVGDLGYALSFPVGSGTRDAINGAYVEAQRMLNLLALLALVPCLFCGSLMENVDLSEPEDHLPPDDTPANERTALFPSSTSTP